VTTTQVPSVRVGVVGAGGRMGRAACAAVHEHPQLELVAAVGQRSAGQQICGLTVASDLKVVADAEVDVLVDFTVVEAARTTLSWAALHGVHAVVGTSGWTADDYATLSATFTRSRCLVSPNFAIGAVLMMRFAELAAPWFNTVDVIEMHHDAKIDAPSGTAMMTLDRIAAASDEWAPDPTKHEMLPGARGGVGPAGIHVHSLRVRGMVAHQEVLMGSQGETLTIRHDSYDRVAFMSGVTLACTRIAELEQPLTLGIEGLLGL
jgi:4-hydroxy-tetrahydrodipicolinate reductase